jgi:hypothetical protein
MTMSVRHLITAQLLIVAGVAAGCETSVEPTTKAERAATLRLETHKADPLGSKVAEENAAKKKTEGAAREDPRDLERRGGMDPRDLERSGGMDPRDLGRGVMDPRDLGRGGRRGRP